MTGPQLTSLGTAAARTLTTTTKSVPQMQAITPRWLTRVLPWIDVRGGTYRLNRTVQRTLPRRGSSQPAVATAAGHAGEVTLPGMYVDYAVPPAEYPMSVAQTVLRVHTRVADLYNEPMNQLEQQLRLAIEALRERQEAELVNNPQFGLLPHAAARHRVRTRTGPPTPDDIDELVCRRRRPTVLLAHPRAIAAFGEQCNRRGVYPSSVQVAGQAVHGWRGIPFLPCDKVPISPAGTTAILVLRTGEERQGVIGLRQTGLPDEYQPGVSVRKLGVDQRAVTSYQVSMYYSVAVLVPNAVGVLDGVELGH